MANNIFFKELKNATLDYKSFFKTLGKDFLTIMLVLTVLMIYTFIMLKTYPQEPWWNEGDKVMQASALELQLKTQELKSYLIQYILLSIIAILLCVIIFTVFKEWIWKDLTKQKYNIKSFFSFLGINILVYLITLIIVVILMLIAGSIIKPMALGNVPIHLIQIFAFIIFIPIAFFTLHFLNFSGYYFVKERRFGKTLLEIFKSLKEIKKLLAPYMVLILIFAIFGTLINYLIRTKKPLLMITSYLIFFIMLSWEKVYSSYFFKRIY